MKHKCLSWTVAILVAPFMLTPSLADANQEYLRLVKHRDVNGNLVIPAAGARMSKKPITQEDSVHHDWGQKELDGLREGHQPQGIDRGSEKELTQQEPSQEMLAQENQASEDPIIKKTVIPSQPKAFSLRDYRWGMTVSEVKANEHARSSWELHAPTLELGQDRLGYYKTVEGLEAFVSYIFTDDQLTNTKYIFEPENQDEAQYLKNYETVKNWIAKSYGSPKSEEVIWLDDLYKYAEELWGKAVVRGHLTMVAEWDVDGTSIVLLLNGGDEKIGLVADFSSQDSSLPKQMVSLPFSFLDHL